MRLILQWSVFLLGCSTLVSTQDQKQVEYYMNLLTNGIQQAQNFILPTDNRRYFGNKVPCENEAKDFGEYDFIIVGAGSSGSVILNRLAKVPEWKILLLEAGGNETDLSDIPTMAFYSHLSPMNWGYNTTSQTKSCLGMNKNQCFYPRGRVVGGSGTINALMYVRGNKEDYDKWEIQGNPGWSFESLLPYFKKSERFEIDDGDIAFHSRNGLLNVTYMKPQAPLVDNFLDANKEMGYKYVDYNGAQQMGYSKLQMNTNNGRRGSGGRIFIDPVRNQSNVNVITNALVTKILINDKDSAYGVNFLKNGKLYKATVSKEVVISAGAINTPQLLMLSGLGPKEELAKFNIPVRKDLPVGKHFQDHPVFIGLNVRTNFTYNKPTLQEQVQRYLQGDGMLTYCLNTQGIKFIHTLDPESTVPDIEFIFVPPPSVSSIALTEYNIKPEFAKAFTSQNALTDFKVLIVLLHPKSLGTVTLKSDSPLDFPNINTNYFTDENDEDVDTIYRAILHWKKVLQTDAFKKLNATIQSEFEGCQEYTPNSKEYWHCTIRYLSSTLYHSSGTARMGPDPSSAVVNWQLKVHGIDNLRIGDCSIIPSSTSGHTNAPAYMIGEKVADFLKQRYQ